MTKLKDIAELAGVSIPTANQILNGFESRFSKTTCEKVLKAAESLSYRPNLAARSLRSNKSYTVGILFFSGNSLYLTDFMHAAQYTLLEHQYAPIFLTHSNSEEEKRNLETCLTRRVDALIANPFIDYQGKARLAGNYEQLKESGMPVVEIFGKFIPGVPKFCFEHREYGFSLTKRLMDKGCRRVGFLTHSLMKPTENLSKKYWNAWEMWQGYENAVKTCGAQSILFSHDLESDTEAEGAFYWNTYQIADRIFSKDNGLNGIVCFNEEQALALVNYGTANGIDLRKFIIATVGRESSRILHGFPVEQIFRPIKQLGTRAVSELMKKIG